MQDSEWIQWTSAIYKLALSPVSVDHAAALANGAMAAAEGQPFIWYFSHIFVFESHVEVHRVVIVIHLGEFFIWWSGVQLLLLGWAAGWRTEDARKDFNT